VDITPDDFEVPVLDREGIRSASEGDYTVVLVKCHLGQEAPGRTIGSEQSNLHDQFLSIGTPNIRTRCLRH
jgi:hypothetical protein